MMIFLSIVVCLVCAIFGTAICAFTYFLLRSGIIEIGYGTKVKQRKLEKHIKSDFRPIEKVMLFRLCKEARLHNRIVWVYGLFNLLNILCLIGIAICCLCSFLVSDVRVLIIIILGAPVFVFLVSGCITFIPDVMLRKTVKRRYTRDNLILLGIVFGFMLFGLVLLKSRQA